jgi:hypothetical protein
MVPHALGLQRKWPIFWPIVSNREKHNGAIVEHTSAGYCLLRAQNLSMTL